MGSCISKCKPSRRKNSNKKEEEEEDQGFVKVPLQDKLVIVTSENQPLKARPPLLPPSLSKAQNASFLFPFSPSHSSSSSTSSSSFSCSTTGHKSSSSSSCNPSLSSASSCASSITNSKEKSSFSNEFLQSCLKENSHIVLLDPNKIRGGCVGDGPHSLSPYHHHRVQPSPSSKWHGSGQPTKPNSPAAGLTQKRQRASSPNLTRQKSFRRDPIGPILLTADKPSSLRSPSPSRRFSSVNGDGWSKGGALAGAQHDSKRVMEPISITANKSSSFRSPSPSRRFSSVNINGDGWSRRGALAGAQHERNCKRVMPNSKGNGNYSKGNVSVVSNSVGAYVKKENLKGLSDPNNRSRRSYRSPSMRKQTEICSLNRVVSSVDEIKIGEEPSISNQDVEMLPVEDLDNPHIALDCFIFL